MRQNFIKRINKNRKFKKNPKLFFHNIYICFSISVGHNVLCKDAYSTVLQNDKFAVLKKMHFQSQFWSFYWSYSSKIAIMRKISRTNLLIDATNWSSCSTVHGGDNSNLFYFIQNSLFSNSAHLSTCARLAISYNLHDG